eukprot:9209185-Pyramimonas_sp.AAC.1
MVVHQGAVALRGGVYIATQYRKETSSDTLAPAECSYSCPTSLRYCTPEVHPPTRIGHFFDDVMHGSVRCDILPPPTPRRLATTTH